MKNMKLIVAVTGASGVIYSESLLQFLSSKEFKIHLIVSDSARLVIENELNDPLALDKLADNEYNQDDLKAPMTSIF